MSKDSKVLTEHAVKTLDRVWTLSRKRRAAKSKRKNLFTERDTLDNQIEELEEGTKEYSETAVKWRAVVKQIEHLKTEIEWYGDEIDQAIEDGEQGKFEFLDEPLKPPAELFEKPKKDDRPVGAPKDAGQVFRENLDKKSQGLAPVGVHPLEGVAEHMYVSVNELDLPELQKGRLVKAGLDTVAKLAAVVDGPGFTTLVLEERCSCSDKQAQQILAAVQAYRKKHRKAAAAVERGDG